MTGRPRLGRHTATGNLTADPVQRETTSGKLTTFRIADTPRIFDRAVNEWKDGETVFYDVAVKNARFGENIKNSLAKGNRVTVAGNYEPVPFVSEGKAGLNHRIWADDVSVSLEFARVHIEPDRAHAEQAHTPAQAAAPAPAPDAAVSPEQAAVDREWGLG
ncbi:single-stranded DNA-binding protein [Arthrobacter bambusae]